ncbi:MAG: hypothetical protein M1433_03045 [Candidatus Parvarchaeota archaeon]|nr:hypothetical protein [Candidatus Parvarchaeota archaeon]
MQSRFRGAYNYLTEIENILPKFFDSRVILCKSLLKDPNIAPDCEKIAFFSDNKNSTEIIYEDHWDKKNRSADLLISREYSLYNKGEETKLFSLVDKLLRTDSVSTMLYEKISVNDTNLEKIITNAYLSLYNDVEDVYVYLPDRFYIHKVKESTVEKLASGGSVDLRLEISMKSGWGISEIKNILELLYNSQ